MKNTANLLAITLLTLIGTAQAATIERSRPTTKPAVSIPARSEMSSSKESKSVKLDTSKAKHAADKPVRQDKPTGKPADKLVEKAPAHDAAVHHEVRHDDYERECGRHDDINFGFGFVFGSSFDSGFYGAPEMISCTPYATFAVSHRICALEISSSWNGCSFMSPVVVVEDPYDKAIRLFKAAREATQKAEQKVRELRWMDPSDPNRVQAMNDASKAINDAQEQIDQAQDAANQLPAGSETGQLLNQYNNGLTTDLNNAWNSGVNSR